MDTFYPPRDSAPKLLAASAIVGSPRTLAIPQSVLRMKAQPVPDVYFDSRTLLELVQQMWSCMVLQRGLGLAAPQVGVSWRLFIAHIARPGIETLPPTVFINPEVTPVGPETEQELEACLSIPGYYSKALKRAKHVSVSYFDMKGRRHTKQFKDFAARIVQHENDHLNGVLFIDDSRDPEAPFDYNRVVDDAMRNIHDGPAEYTKDL